jgi:hypothetical protein
MKFPSVGAALLVAGVCLAGPAGAEVSPMTPDLERAGWKIVALPESPATRFSGRADGIIDVAGEDSFAMLYRGISDANRRQPFLTWRWRVDTTIPPTDLTRKGHDDRPLALHLWFPEDPDQMGLLKKLGRLIAWVLDVPVPGKVLTYVWGGIGRRGDSMINPHLEDDGVIIILRPGGAPTGRWFSERIDIGADFERAFGGRAPSPAYVAVSADADDTGGRIEASISDIEFRRR